MKFLHRTIASFLLGLMTIVVIPVEVVHSFFGHDDSEDVHTENSHVTGVETEHRHCLILKCEFREFLPSQDKNTIQTEFIPVLVSYHYVNPYFSANYNHKEQRGPPASLYS